VDKINKNITVAVIVQTYWWIKRCNLILRLYPASNNCEVDLCLEESNLFCHKYFMDGTVVVLSVVPVLFKGVFIEK
jgi:hypothetical protein